MPTYPFRTPARAHGMRALIAGFTAGLFVLASVVVPAVSASADEPAALRNVKSASVTDALPGQSFNWVDEVGCSVLSDECVNAVLTDTMPAEFTIGDASTILVTGALTPADYTVTVVGQLITISFKQALSSPAGSFGLKNGIVNVTIPVTVRSDLDAATSHPVTNTSSISADNAPTVPSSASVGVTVPLQLASTTSKDFAPATNITSPGVATTLSLGGSNTSNAAVDTLVVQDPQTPASGDIFGSTLLIQSPLGAVTWPAGATSATVALWDNTTSNWVSAAPVAVGGTLAYPAGVTLANARGVRITFTSGSTAAIPRNASTSFTVALQNRSGLAVGSVSNTAQASVQLATGSASSTATKTYVLSAASTSVGATKSISPSRLSTVAFGASDLTTGTVSLGASNTGTVALKSLTISEPSTPSSLLAANPLAPAHIGGGLIFSGFTSGVSWPSGATGVSITYYYADGSSETKTGTTVNAIPAAAAAPARVTGFALTFTGTIAQSAVAAAPYTITANPAQVAPDLSVPYSNTITVTGTSVFDQAAPAKTATAPVTVLADQITITAAKTGSATDLISSPGQSVLTTLKSTISNYPDTTRAVTKVELVDPSVETGLTDWYNYFNATGIVAVQVPGDSKLTVQYRDSAGNYTNISGFVDLGPGTYSQSFPSDILDSAYGIKFVWTSTTGFVPGSALTANLQYALRSTLRADGTALPNADLSGLLKNCAASVGTGGTVVSNRSVSSCITVNLHAATGGGGTVDLLDKDFLITGNAATPQDLIVTRNSNTTRTRLSWSTGGYTNVSSMVIYDGPPADSSGNPITTGWQKGMWDAFNLQTVSPITTALDPLSPYDQVAIQLYNVTTSTWETPSGWTCTVAAPCTMPQPSRTLTAGTQQDSYIAIRYIFTEKPGRVAGGSTPAPGSGVAASFAHNRHIDLVFQLRNSLRSSSTTPVVNGYRYNVDVPVTDPASFNSSILNGATAVATIPSGLLTDAASDTIALQDPNLAVSSTKTWAGGTLAIPSGTVSPTAPRPSGRVTITSVNQTAGVVSSLTVQEPNPSASLPNDTPFDEFDLLRFSSLTHPTGATGLTITVTRSAGGNLTTTGTPAAATTAALAWTTAQLADATGFTLVYTGAIAASNGTSTVVFDLALRRTHRSDPTLPISQADSPVFNSTQATVADSRFDTTSPTTAPTFVSATVSGQSGASKDLQASSIGVNVSKSFTPATQTEPTRTAVAMNLVATPTGTERVTNLVVTDDRVSFWNAFDYTGFTGLTLPTFSPNPTGAATQVQVEFCKGRTYVASAIAADPTSNCTATGGVWVTTGFQTSTTITLPSGLTAAQVGGIRITVKRQDGSQWENPQAPTLTFPVSVTRRLALHSGGDVLTDYQLNNPAPGETAKGTTTNGVSAAITGAWGSTASASNTATYLYAHATSGVQVLKTPSGAKAPGQLFNYTLQVKNTGSWPIANPVITDYLPSDASGAMLVFDPDAPPVYTYALTGAAPSPATGTALPVGSSGPTVVVVSDGPGPQKITFTFPTGAAGAPVLEVGQTYTISIPMMFRPGLTYATAVTNTFGIKGDRLFETCTTPTGQATYNSTTGECSTGTTVNPAQQPALRAFMSTKAVVDTAGGFPDQGFTGGTNPNCTAAEDASGFSRLPCVPLTLPGQKEIWRLTAQNTGTTEMPRLVLATSLPSVGDKTILDGFLRKSAWAASFADAIAATIAIPGATFTPYYTTAAAPCKLVLQSPANTNACGSDPATGWAPWVAGTIADPTTVTALQFIIDFDPAHYFRPGESLTVDVTTKTAALSSTPGANTTANNSLSASARSTTGTTQTNVTALDYSRVSVALATGSVTLDKAITGAGASHIPAGQTFAGQLVCTSLGQTTTRDFTFTYNGTTVSPSSITFTNLPGGALCTATETAASGQTGYTATTVTVDPKAGPTALPAVHLVNNYDLTSLTVSKTVTSTATVVPTGYHFTVDCTFLGKAVPLAAADAKFTLNATQSRTITGLPINTTCAVVEDDPKGADSTVLSGHVGTGGSVTFTDPTRTAQFTLGAESTPVGANSVNFDNRFDAPAVLAIQKSFDGNASDQFGSSQDSFTVHVLCTYGTTTPDQYDADVMLYKNQGFKANLQNIIAGSDCVITEPDLQHADTVVITPNDGSHTATGVLVVPDTASPVVQITVTNWYLTGSLKVTKVFAGDPDAITKYAVDPNTQFTVSLACTLRGTDVTIPGGATRTVTAANPVANYSGLASGAACALTETETGGAAHVQILDANGNPVDGTFTVAVTVPDDASELTPNDQPQPALQVQNTFTFATVSATKHVDSSLVDGAGHPLDYGNFTLELACTLDGVPISAAEDATQSVADGGTATWTQLAEGADCTVTETDARGAASTTYLVQGATTPVDGTAAALEPLRPTTDETPNSVAFTNSYAAAGLTISKTVTSNATVVPTAFHFTVECSFLGNDIALAAADAAFTLDANGTHTISGLPAGADCTVTEDDAKGAESTVVTAETDATTGGSVVLDDDARTAEFVLSPNGEAAAVTNAAHFDNRFDAPAVLSIQKAFAGGAAEQFGEKQTSFTVHVTCQFGTTEPLQYDGDVVLAKSSGFKATLQDIIAGSVCTITEPDLQGADAVVITPNNGSKTDTGVVTIPSGPGSNVSVAVTNRYLTGSLDVTKTFAGDQGAIDKFGIDSGVEYDFTLACTRDGQDVVIPDGNDRTVTGDSPVAHYTGIASGAVCVLTETAQGGAVSSRVLDHNGNPLTDNTVTIVVDPTKSGDGDQAQRALSVENTFHFASMSVSKHVDSPLLDGNGNALDYGDFSFELACTLDGNPITAAESATQLVADGGTATWTELAEGADCTVTETDTRSAASTTWVVGSDGPVAGTVASLPALLPTSSETPNAVAFTNSYTTAGLTITKAVTSVATVIPTGFHFTVECTFLGNEVALAAGDASFILDANGTHTITGLPATAECTVTEDDPKGADATVVTGETDSAHGGSVVLDDTARTAVFTLSPNSGSAATNAAHFDNRFDAPAVLSIQKQFDGAAAAQFGESQDTFTVHVTCRFGDTSPIQFDADVVLAKSSGWKATIGSIIAGSTCTITEPNLQGADAVVITPNNGTDTATGVVTIPNTAIVAVDVTNWYLTGSLQVTKTFAGDDGAIQKFGIDSGSQYEFALACTRDGQDVTLPGGGTRTVTGADPVALYTGIASGAVCVLTETAQGGAVSSRIIDSNGDPATGATIVVNPATLSDTDQPQSPLRVENTFRFASVTASKIVSQSVPTDHGSFGITLTCTLDGNPISAKESATQQVTAGASVTWTQLAEGSQCTVEETNAQGASKTTYAVGTSAGDAGTPASGRVAVLDPLRPLTGAANSVTFVNTYALASTGFAFDDRLVLVPVLVLLLGATMMAWVALRRRRRNEA